MKSVRSSNRRWLVALIGAVTALIVSHSFGLVVTQILGSGGNTAASSTHRSVEIINDGANAVDLSQFSILYANAGTYGGEPLTALLLLPHFALPSGYQF